MLNRIYIVVGLIAIVVLAAAFIAPRFIHWGDYRDRMEVLASGVLGADVTIRGDIAFSLLPSPRLEFSDVIVGDAEAPAATVTGVEAEFALIDFLRDNYTVTALRLVSPTVNLTIDENGFFGSGVDLSGAGSGVALGQTTISNGALRLEDVRSGEVFTANRIDGDFRLSSFVGPFQFQGAADYDDGRYTVRVNSGTVDTDGNVSISAYAAETFGGFSLTLDGMLAAGMAPKFEGTLAYRQAPPASDAAEDIRGDLLLETPVTASTDRVVLSGYTLQPDENRAGMRLTGAASIQLGARRQFDAVVSGGVFALPPRDATEVPGELPYEFVRLLSEIPAPPLPPMPGQLGVDLAEVGLRGFALRELRLDATTDGSVWTIDQAVATLPGDSEVRIAGQVSNDDGRIGFNGDLAITTERLDALAQLWRKPLENNPLFNLGAALEGQVLLGSDALGLTDGRLTVDGVTHGVELRVGYGEEPRLDAVLNLAALTGAQTTALRALIPDVSADANFGITFPDGSLSLTAAAAELFGLAGTDLAAEAQWSPDALSFSRLAGEWGGMAFDTALRFSGSLMAPHVSGSGTLSVAAPDAAGLAAAYDWAAVPASWRTAMAGFWPGRVQFLLSDDSDGSGQVLTASGEVAGASLDLRAEVTDGLAAVSTSDMRLVASLETDDAAATQDRLGLGTTPIFAGDGAMLASLFLEGSAADGFDGRMALGQGGQSISYFGNVRGDANGNLLGEGTVDVLVDDASGLAALVGVDGTSLPALEASAALALSGDGAIALANISGVSGDTGLSGSISVTRRGQLTSFSGNLSVDTVDASGLAAALFGSNALIGVGDGSWPDGPLAATDQPRSSRGEILVDAGRTTLNGSDFSGPASFAFSWAPDSVAIDRFSAEIGGGTVGLSLSQCCSGALTDRTITGRLTLAGVDLDAIAPPGVAAGLSGRLDAGVQFEATGPSLAEAVRAMSGEGNFTIANLEATGLSAAVYPSVAGIEDVLNTEADALETLLSLALSQGNFTADEAQGAFTIAGGTARFANLIIEGAGARLAGNLQVLLSRLGLNGRFVMTPFEFTDPSGLVEPDSARIVATIGGTVTEPQVSVDLSELVAAVQVRANELELQRLDTLRLEDEARQRAAAEARNQLVEQQRRAAEEAARIAAEEEARRLEEERLLQEQLNPTTPPPATTTPVPPTLPPGPFEFIPPPTISNSIQPL